MVPAFTLFGKTLSAYQITALVGILFTLFFTYFLAKKSGKDEITAMFMLLIAAPGVIIGGVLLFGVTNLSDLVTLIRERDSYSSQEFLSGVINVFSGSVFYGGLLGGMLCGGIYIRKKPDRGAYADLGAVAAPLFHSFGRLGCFLTGCCYGVECELGFVYHYSLVPGANDVSRFPVQLVEMGLNIALFFFLLHLYRKGKKQGKLLQLYLLIYPIYRFILEFIRGDAHRGFLFGLSTSQIISILILLGNLIFTLCTKNGKKKEADPC